MHERPPTGDLVLLAVGVVCASASPPLIAACAAPALAIAFWRTGAAALLIAPVALARGGPAPWRAVGLSLGARGGVCAHFRTFIPRLSFTAGASSAAPGCSQAGGAGVLG